MNKLEPTYLRYVYDGLKNNILDSQNSSSLPNGLIGLFEQEICEEISVIKRSSTLKKLGLWSVFKIPVSCELVSRILVVDEEEIKLVLDKYSKWFNSPVAGKYIIFHDRLRTYLLQKLGEWVQKHYTPDTV